MMIVGKKMVLLVVVALFMRAKLPLAFAIALLPILLHETIWRFPLTVLVTCGYFIVMGTIMGIFSSHSRQFSVAFSQNAGKKE